MRHLYVYQTEDSFVIRIELDDAVKENHPKIVYICDDVTAMDSVVKNGNISFRTNHNSFYAIVTEKTTEEKSPIANTAAQTAGSGQIA